MIPQPGDLIFCHGTGLISGAIRLGERIRFRGRHEAYWNHVAIVVDPEDGRPRVVQAGGSGVVVSWLSDLGSDYQIIEAERFPALIGYPSRDVLVQQAYALVGAKYGWLTIVSIVLNLLTPKWIRFPDFRRGSTYICSAAGAWCLHAAGAEIDTYDVYQVFPSELAAMADA